MVKPLLNYYHITIVIIYLIIVDIDITIIINPIFLSAILSINNGKHFELHLCMRSAIQIKLD